jgi:hypothetical protein
LAGNEAVPSLLVRCIVPTYAVFVPPDPSLAVTVTVIGEPTVAPLGAPTERCGDRVISPTAVPQFAVFDGAYSAAIQMLVGLDGSTAIPE